MTCLQRDLWRRWLGLGALLTVVLATVLLALTVADSLRWTRTVPLQQVLHWVVLQLPAVLVRVLPVAMLTSSAIVIGDLVASREALAVRAGGVRVRRLLRPWWPSLALIVAASVALSQWLVPGAERQAAELWWTITEGSPAMHRLARTELRLPQATTVRFARYDERTDTLHGLRVTRLEDDRVIVVRATTARWQGRRLTLAGGTRVVLHLDALERDERDPEALLSALATGPEPVEAIALSEERSETVARYSGGTFGDGRSLSRQWQVANDPGSSYGARRWAALVLHEKLAAAAGSLTLTFGAAVIALRYARSVTMAFGLATTVGLGWFVLAAAGQWLVVSALVPPWLGAWAGHLLVLAATVAVSARR